MNILAIETTGAEASVAVINETGQVFMEASDQKLNHLQNLMPMTDILLSKCGLTIDDVDIVAVSEGPGSFTGIRIGVSSARALAQALGRKTIGVPTLKSFLFHMPEYRGIICPIFDARRSQVYGGAYQWNFSGQAGKTAEEKLPGGVLQQADPEALLPGMAGTYSEVVPGNAYELSELLERLEKAVQTNLEKEVTFFGDGIIPYRDRIMKWQNESLKDNIRVLFAEDDKMLQNASSVAKFALAAYRSGETKSLYDLKPVYMRKAEAERKLEGKA